jgi:hypothetical protein
MKSEPYFQNRNRTRKALARYALFASGKGEKGWSIAESKLRLYRHAVNAFAGTSDERIRRASHEEVYGRLRSWWGVGRNGTLWERATVFDVLENNCRACSRSSGLTLNTLEDEQTQTAVVACLESMRGLKRLRSGHYPVMAVSKNLHFFNPRLWVIYDNEVVVGKVYRVFKEEWAATYGRIAVETGDADISFYLAYLLWASHSIRNAYAGFMDDFADWFIATVRHEGEEAEDFRGELRSSFATAFEFIIIGAAHLEGGDMPCIGG